MNGKKCRQVAIYGKGGIGKSTTTANTTAAMASIGKKILQVGCDPKHDSTKMLLGGKAQVTVLDIIKEKGQDGVSYDDIILVGYGGIRCVEAGGPEPGIGCAGRGVIYAFETLERLGAYNEEYDFIFYDVLGDVVCGGFAMPIRSGYAKEIYLVASGELMSLYAANNICKGIIKFAKRGDTRLAGIIGNERKVKNERELMGEFARRIGSQLMQFIPRHPIVQRAEINKKTVIEFAPESDQAEVYRTLAKRIVENDRFVIPEPLAQEELERLVYEFEGFGEDQG